MRLCIVSSPGGHLAKMIKLKPWWRRYDRFWVTHLGSGQTDYLQNETIIAGCFPENRNLYNFFRNLILAIKVCLRLKPTVMVSMGAGIAAPFFLVGKLFGCKLIFIETFVFIASPTISGKILYHIADEFIVQNKHYLSFYPKATLCEWLI